MSRRAISLKTFAAEIVMSLVTAMKRLLFTQRFNAALFRQTFTWHDTCVFILFVFNRWDIYYQG